MPKQKAPHHRGTHQVRAKKLTDAANANPDTRCWRCRRTIHEVRLTKPNAKWTAGHLIDGMVDGPLAPECSPCNYAAGARLTNNRRARRPNVSRAW